MKICVVGLGNIGLNIYSHLITKFPNSVTGIDIDRTRVHELQKLGHTVTSDYTAVGEIDVWLLATSTGPSAEQIFRALAQMEFKTGCLLSIESTLPPGTMNRIMLYLKARGLELGSNLYLIHVPHRVMFGQDITVFDTPRVMGAFTPACLDKGREFYGPLVPGLVETLDVRIAELSKVVENSLRFVDIAFAQEIYRYCAASGIDFEALRRAVNSKDNVELLGVDWGIGGECLPKDIGFLSKVHPAPLLVGAMDSDAAYKKKVISRVGKGKSVVVKGVSYKPGVKSLGYSVGAELVRSLEMSGNKVWVEDPLFSPEELAEAGFKVYKKAEHHGLPEFILSRHAPLENEKPDKGDI